MSRLYHMCHRYKGRMVWIRCHDGSMHRGRIMRVTPSHVYLAPMAGAISGKAKDSSTEVKNALGAKEQAKGSEVQFFYPYALPLAAIAGIGLIGAAAAFSPFFWW